jgi:general secretion pathway protein K
MQQRSPPENLPGRVSDNGDVSAYRPQNMSFQNIGDLRLLPGMTPALFERIAPMLTVYSQAADVNPVFATDEVLNLFSDESPIARQALEARQVARRHDREPPQKQGVALGHAYTITAEATDPGARAVSRQTAVVRLTGHRDAPLLVYRWD